LEKRNAVLIGSVDKLEDKLIDSEEQRMNVQRKLLIADEESADYRTLIDQRESQNASIRKELDQLGTTLQNEISRYNEVDNEKRKLEHQVALVQGEAAINARASAKLNQTMEEIENLRQKLTSILNEKGELDQQVSQRKKEVTELEKRLHSESQRSRDINSRTTHNLENLIEHERKRAQQSIDYVRQTLKAKIRVLETQVEADRESDLKIKNEKRSVQRELKQVMRKLDQKKSEVGLEKRKIETLEKQLMAEKERLEKTKIQISSEEQKFHSLQREISTLATQLDSALYSNAKLNSLLPSQIRLAIEEEAEARTERKTKQDKEKVAEPTSPSSYAPRSRREKTQPETKQTDDQPAEGGEPLPTSGSLQLGDLDLGLDTDLRLDDDQNNSEQVQVTHTVVY